MTADQPLLQEPDIDAGRVAAERALAEAAAAMASQSSPTGDAAVIALHQALEGLSARQKRMALAVRGRLSPPPTVCGPAAALLAADRYGLGARAVATPEEALKAARNGMVVLIDVAGSPWWGRLLAEPSVCVTAALPDDGSAPRALCLERRQPGPTGGDRTYWVTDSRLSDARIVAEMAAAGLIAEPLAEARGLKLFMLAGYVQASDPRLADAPGALSGVIGAAPIF